MSDTRYTRWKSVGGEVIVFCVSLVAAGFLTDVIVPVHLPASAVVFGEEAERLMHRVSVHYWVGVLVWIVTYCLLHFAYRRCFDEPRSRVKSSIH